MRRKASLLSLAVTTFPWATLQRMDNILPSVTDYGSSEEIHYAWRFYGCSTNLQNLRQ